MSQVTLKVFAEADPGTLPTAEFRRKVMAILTDSRGWPRAGIQFVEAPNERGSDLWIRLSPNSALKREGFDMMSCAWVSGKKSLINLERWLHGSDKSGLSVENYRRYVINHETGHLLGLRDNMTTSKDASALAPVMVQHTLGTRGYRANNRPRDDEIASVVRLGVGRLVVAKSAAGGARKKRSRKKSQKKRKA
jgi:hypothetical protein